MRYQRVYTEFWPETRDWPEAQRALALYLLTCEHRRTEGLFRLRPAYMADDLGWQLERLESALQGLVDRDWIVFDGSWLCLVGALRLREQRPAGPKQIAGAISAVQTAPRDGAPYRAFHAAAERYAPEFAESLDTPPDTPSKGYHDGVGYTSDSSSSSSGSSSTSKAATAASHAGAHEADASPPDSAAAIAPDDVRRMLVDAGYPQLEIDESDGAIQHALRTLKLPDDVDWWRFGQEIQRHRASGTLRRGPAAAIKFVARSAQGPPRRGGHSQDAPAGRVDHYAAMAGGPDGSTT